MNIKLKKPKKIEQEAECNEKILEYAHLFIDIYLHFKKKTEN